MQFNVYDDIEQRTNGEIYIGVVGPVRTGKSTFIKNFMNLAVIPRIKDENDLKRTVDELPQSSSGKTIMTTEPKFIPNKAVSIDLDNHTKMKVRLIDCVGFMVDGATGHMEEDVERMVKTPWFSENIPFSRAAEIGTEKVISEHSTIGIVITSDGSFTDLDAEAYNDALDKTVMRLKSMQKPFVILMNSAEPESELCKALCNQIQRKYNISTVPMNCLHLTERNIHEILEQILFEFPVTEVRFNTPKWLDIMDKNQKMIQDIIDVSKDLLSQITYVKDLNGIQPGTCEYIHDIQVTGVDLSNGTISIGFEIDDRYYYDTLTEMTGIEIKNQLQLIQLVKELSGQKNHYVKFKEAINSVKSTGYGIVTPEKEEILLEEPELIRNGNKYGVKIKAVAPAVHFVKTDIVTEISPIIGAEEQAEDLIRFINDRESGNEDIWETNIFGKTIGQIVNEGIANKINNLSEDTRTRMQGTVEKITNDQSRGVICIVL
ncbi:MAG: stage IV sporulation protein A [Eubacterium sp.]|nr:stage IV sporulation protein A [Eubacterium sp.]